MISPKIIPAKLQRSYVVTIQRSGHDVPVVMNFATKQYVIDFMNSIPDLDLDQIYIRITVASNPRVMKGHLYYAVYNFEERSIEYFSEYSTLLFGTDRGQISFSLDQAVPEHIGQTFGSVPSLVGHLQPFLVLAQRGDKWPLMKFYHISPFDMEMEYDFLTWALAYLPYTNSVYASALDTKSYKPLIKHEELGNSQNLPSLVSTGHNFAYQEKKWHLTKDTKALEHQTKTNALTKQWLDLAFKPKSLDWNTFVDHEDPFALFENWYPGCFDPQEEKPKLSFDGVSSAMKIVFTTPVTENLTVPIEQGNDF